MRLIDADALVANMNLAIALIKRTMKNFDIEDDPECQMELKAYQDIRDGIKEEPTIEPERKTGEWIGTEYDGYADGNPVYYEWKCSKCGCIIEEGGRPTYNYCPQCGANMRGEAGCD